VTAQLLEDFASIAGIEFLIIDNETKLSEFKKELCWNDVYYYFVTKINLLNLKKSIEYVIENNYNCAK
jgi:hypothetical protein